MIFSTYCYHSNYTPYTITFINDSDLYHVIIFYNRYEDYADYDDDIDIDDETANEYSFVINKTDLESSGTLFHIYKLSLLMTKDTSKLIYSKKGSNASSSHKWCLQSLKNWKGMYFTKNYEEHYGFDEYPLSIPDNIQYNEQNKEYYIYLFNTSVLYTVDDIYYDYLTTSKLTIIENDINNTSKLLYNIGLYDLCSKKVLSCLNTDLISTILNMIIAE